MGIPAKDEPIAFGFLTVLEHENHGFMGGYLVISVTGRPLEFHCTAPVQTSRAQEILYGPTLRSYLFGEQIGTTLLKKAKIKSQVVLVDSSETLCLRPHITQPMVFLSDPEANSQSTPSHDASLEIAESIFQLATGFDSDRKQLEPLLTKLALHVQFSEPFGRIREAIREAQRISTPQVNNLSQAG